GGEPGGDARAVNPGRALGAIDQRRIHRRKQWSRHVVVTLERGPCRVDNERGKSKKDSQWLNPPVVRARGGPEPSAYQRNINLWHKNSSLSDRFKWPRKRPFLHGLQRRRRVGVARRRTALGAGRADVAVEE